MSTITSFITPFTTTPSRQQPLTFSADMDTRLSQENARITSMNAMGVEMNIVSGEVNTNASNAVSAAAAAVASANFQGTWTNQLTAIGQSWEYSGVIYGVLVAGTASPITTPANWFALTIAQNIYFPPSGSISSSTVNGAIQELDAEKAPLLNPVFTGNISFEGSTVDAFQTTLTAANPTSDNTLIIPDKSGPLATTSDIITATSALAFGVRQTVQSASVDTSGFANFLSIGTGLNVNIAATTTPLKIHSSGGAISADRLGTISADKTLLLPASSTSYIYESVATTGVCTSGSTTLAPIYQFGGTPAVTNGQFTYNISEGKGYLGNGTTAPQVWMIFTGEAVTGASTVTSVVTYALNGVYIGTWFAVSATTTYSKNHNIGTPCGESVFLCASDINGTNPRITNQHSSTTPIGYTITASTRNSVSALTATYVQWGASENALTTGFYQLISRRGW